MIERPLSQHQPPVLWKRGLAWLAFLGPFFFLTYGLTNYYTSQRNDVGVFVSDWEHHLPFVPWLMPPYMSIDAFYGASLLMYRKRSQLDRHALRLLLATLLCCTGFLLFPLRFSFEIPHAQGFNGILQDILFGFDKPFNQAPSLHIALLVILWVAYAKKLHGLARLALHMWFAAIGISVLLVYQHHFIDCWTGAIAGLICLYLVPDRPFFWIRKQPNASMQTIGKRYALTSLLLIMLAIVFAHYSSPTYLILLWPVVSLALVAAAYFGYEKHIFQRYRGKMGWPARLLLAPYLLGVLANRRYYLKAPVAVRHNIWLGPFPFEESRPEQCTASLDLTNEFISAPSSIVHKRYLPVMDLTPPSPRILILAARWLDKIQQQEIVLVHCALGFSRSASVIICWLVWRGHAKDLEAASMELQRLRPGIVLSPIHIANIEEALRVLKEGS